MSKVKKILGIAVGLFVVLLLIGALSSGSKDKTPTSTGTDTKQTTTPGLNQQANDGKLGFTVASLQCGVNEVDQPGDTDGLFTATTGAPYCLMKLSVTGVGTTAQSFDISAQYIYADGNQYSVDTDATIYANTAGDNCMDYPTINPGSTMACTLAFDVPAGVTPTYAMLHDSSLSGGVKVNLQ